MLPIILLNTMLGLFQEAAPDPSTPVPPSPDASQPSVAASPDLVSGEAESLVETLKALKWPETAEEWESVLLLVSFRVLLPLIGVLLVFVLGLFAAKQIRKATERALTRARIEITLARFLSKVASWTFIGLVILTILSTVGVNVTSLAALLGATGLAVGLALQGALTNLSAGVMLLIFRPYRLGDVVRLDGELGTVADIELFTTRIDTFDNRRIILPNSKIYGNKIENLTRNPQRRVEIPVGVSYKADFEQTRRALESAAANVPGILPTPTPVVIATAFGDSSVNWEVRVWCAPPDVVKVRSDAIGCIKKSLADHGIEIPFPQRDLHLDGAVSVSILDRH
ncbi:MAG: mechanosensitive ion channel family protein [Phycisphaeraceae bacterium]|nr:MAG: mechanosensitive ion channel family protein [Phycisphaeraceae bacterium]